jgi:hypothetical protein
MSALETLVKAQEWESREFSMRTGSAFRLDGLGVAKRVAKATAVPTIEAAIELFAFYGVGSELTIDEDGESDIYRRVA